jgi:flagellar biosynthesis protein FlhG
MQSDGAMPADQASGLRRLADPKPVRVIAVASGKGGVGKTNVSVNLAVSLAAAGKRVMLLDADLGLANVDLMLGLNARTNLSHVLDGERSLEEVLVEGPYGLQIVPGASGIKKMADLAPAEVAGIINAFGELGHGLDVLIVDTAAGISDSVIRFTQACQELVVVVCDEPASITDAYALIKVISRDYGRSQFRILANMAPTAREGRELFLKLVKAADRFLDVTLDYMGHIPFDEYLRKAVQRQKAVVDVYPGSKSAKAFKKLVEVVDNWPVDRETGGHLQFFFERLVQSGRAGTQA